MAQQLDLSGILGAIQSQGQVAAQNRARREAKKAQQLQTIGTLAGAAAGALLGPPGIAASLAAAQAGAGIGSTAGSLLTGQGTPSQGLNLALSGANALVGQQRQATQQQALGSLAAGIGTAPDPSDPDASLIRTPQQQNIANVLTTPGFGKQGIAALLAQGGQQGQPETFTTLTAAESLALGAREGTLLERGSRGGLRVVQGPAPTRGGAAEKSSRIEREDRFLTTVASDLANGRPVSKERLFRRDLIRRQRTETRVFGTPGGGFFEKERQPLPIFGQQRPAAPTVQPEAQPVAAPSQAPSVVTPSGARVTSLTPRTPPEGTAQAAASDQLAIGFLDRIDENLELTGNLLQFNFKGLAGFIGEKTQLSNTAVAFAEAKKQFRFILRSGMPVKLVDSPKESAVLDALLPDRFSSEEVNRIRVKFLREMINTRKAARLNWLKDNGFRISKELKAAQKNETNVFGGKKRFTSVELRTADTSAMSDEEKRQLLEELRAQ